MRSNTCLSVASVCLAKLSPFTSAKVVFRWAMPSTIELHHDMNISGHFKYGGYCFILSL